MTRDLFKATLQVMAERARSRASECFLSAITPRGAYEGLKSGASNLTMGRDILATAEDLVSLSHTDDEALRAIIVKLADDPAAAPLLSAAAYAVRNAA